MTKSPLLSSCKTNRGVDDSGREWATAGHDGEQRINSESSLWGHERLSGASRQVNRAASSAALGKEMGNGNGGSGPCCCVGWWMIHTGRHLPRLGLLLPSKGGPKRTAPCQQHSTCQPARIVQCLGRYVLLVNMEGMGGQQASTDCL